MLGLLLPNHHLTSEPMALRALQSAQKYNFVSVVYYPKWVLKAIGLQFTELQVGSGVIKSVIASHLEHFRSWEMTFVSVSLSFGRSTGSLSDRLSVHRPTNHSLLYENVEWIKVAYIEGPSKHKFYYQQKNNFNNNYKIQLKFYII